MHPLWGLPGINRWTGQACCHAQREFSSVASVMNSVGTRGGSGAGRDEFLPVSNTGRTSP